MNKSQFVDALSAKFEGNKKAAAEALDAVVDTITREVARGEKVVITGFGAFEKRVREARVVRNPQTGELIEAAKKAVPKFTPGADLRNVISGAKQLPAATVEAAGDAASGLVAKVTGRGSRKGSSPAPTETATEAAPAKKAPAKKAPAKKAPAKKAPAKKAPAKKAPAKKATTASSTSTAAASPATKSTAKKSPATKSPAKKSSATKSTATKTTTKKTPATKKGSATKKASAATKAPAEKAPAKKAPAKKAPAASKAAESPAPATPTSTPDKPSSDA
ncbi:MAG: HU family DNA-binding protein [Nocardioides alkalitolerans]